MQTEWESLRADALEKLKRRRESLEEIPAPEREEIGMTVEDLSEELESKLYAIQMREEELRTMLMELTNHVMLSRKENVELQTKMLEYHQTVENWYKKMISQRIVERAKMETACEELQADVAALLEMMNWVQRNMEPNMRRRIMSAKESLKMACRSLQKWSRRL